MPTYVYTTNDGENYEFVFSVGKAPKTKTVSCGKKAYRNISAEHGEFKHKPGLWPMKSWAIGVQPNQIPEAIDEAAKVGIKIDFSPEGDAIFTSAKHRKQYCEFRGVFDRNGGYGDPQRK